MDEILFDKEIIKSVAAELGMEESKIKHHMKFMTSHLEELMGRDELHTIRLPYIGTMYRNIKACASMVNNLERYEPTERRLKAAEESKKHIEDLLEKLKTFDNFSLHNYKRRLFNPFFKLGKSKEELEKFQNNE